MAILRDGFQTWIFVSAANGSFPAGITPVVLPNATLIAGVVFLEKEVTPPDIDGGGINDTTTMRNFVWRTRQPKKLKTLDKMTVKVAYDDLIYNVATIGAYINQNTQMRVDFPDFQSLRFWGWINKFTPEALKEGEQPMAELEFFASNQNNLGTEIAPVTSAFLTVPAGFTI